MRRKYSITLREFMRMSVDNRLEHFDALSPEDKAILKELELIKAAARKKRDLEEADTPEDDTPPKGWEFLPQYLEDHKADFEKGAKLREMILNS